MKNRDELIGELRYAIRLTQRTARLYRRVQTAGVFLSIVSGSAALGGLMGIVPGHLPLLGGLLVAIFGGGLIAIRPGDKAAMNESDTRRYLALMVRSHQMEDAALAAAIDEAHQGDCAEIEPLRDIAYNDVALERNRPDAAVTLNFQQKILAALA